MILRRFMEHLRDQNWFAVGLDILVVIVGIFLGLQFTDWNEARKLKADEIQFLQDLKGELSADLTYLTKVLEFQETKGEKMRALEQLLSDPSDSFSADSVAVQYKSAVRGNDTFFPDTGVYNSGVTTGRMEIINERELRYAIMNLYGHFYTRLQYNGEINDQNQEKMKWDDRLYVDDIRDEFLLSGKEDLRHLAGGVRLLIKDNTIYVNQARNVRDEIERIIGEIDSYLLRLE